MEVAGEGGASDLTDYPDKPRARVCAAYIGGMTTFAGQMDFTAPQPFNVELSAEEAPCQPQSAPIIGPALPVVAQEITPDRDLYPRVRYGVVRRA